MMQLYEIYSYFQRKYVTNLVECSKKSNSFDLDIDILPKMWINRGRIVCDTIYHWTIVLLKQDEAPMEKDIVSIFKTMTIEIDEWNTFRLAYSWISGKRIRTRSFSSSSLSSTNATTSNAKFVYSSFTLRTSIVLSIYEQSLLHVFIIISTTVSFIIFISKYVHRISFDHVTDRTKSERFIALFILWPILSIVLSRVLRFDGFVVYKFEPIDEFRWITNLSNVFIFLVV